LRSAPAASWAFRCLSDADGWSGTSGQVHSDQSEGHSRGAAVTSALAFQGPASFKVDSKVVAQSAAAAVTFAALPAFAGDAAAGESVFSGNCAACHAGGQNVIMPEKTLQQEALEEYLDGGANVASVVKQVTNGKNAMPAFGGRLSDDDIQNVATYVIATAKAGWED